MPNHIKNKLEIHGTDNQVKEVLDFLRGEPNQDGSETFIDFNKIIPMPECLMIDHDGWTMTFNNEFAKNAILQKEIEKLKNFCENNPKNKEKTVNNFITAIKNYIDYGHATWYSWCCDNWGTKWNAYSQEKPESNILIFETAWSGIPSLINKLSTIFPDVSFTYMWSDEDIGSNCGTGSYKNGEEKLYYPDTHSFDAYEIAFELRPEIKEDYNFINGNYIYIEED